MPREEVIGYGIRGNERMFARIKYSNLIFVAVISMVVILIYVWSHIQMRELEYRVAEEMNVREQLLEEQRKLKLECATLQSPQRIEAIARNKLQMSYPEREQIVLLK
ncbi:MAG: cell division protein FtsL [Syntrophaceae bacterium CG2_30_49_12]|nr:MAG: cell division protein FtsL [Syntrophaceae bacterium CG2_30_49_12]PIP05211.1 MAG: cell division protein FtsL [Syntrophobacterales bacterium CG23_combo_of_CG06-09_8_20_14_all_48_27]PJC73890.1 MAG: cell division protein FtsL [Syntrophobacterales bacterium CG_4_8_14_3_um_filter_49_14]